MDDERCDSEVFERGEVALVIAGLASKRAEAWAIRVRERSGQRVDWSYFAGRPVVKFIGDRVTVAEAIDAEAPALIDAWLAEANGYGSLPQPGWLVARNHIGPDIVVPAAQPGVAPGVEESAK